MFDFPCCMGGAPIAELVVAPCRAMHSHLSEQFSSRYRHFTSQSLLARAQSGSYHGSLYMQTLWFVRILKPRSFTAIVQQTKIGWIYTRRNFLRKVPVFTIAVDVSIPSPQERI